MSNINISVTEQDPINVSIASPEVQNVDISAQSISASVPDGDKGDIVVTGNGSIWTLDPNALSTRVPYTGATADVNLGEFGLLTGNIEFDTSPTNAPTGAGSMVWNDTEGTLDLKLKGANVTIPLGQKQVLRAVNGTGGNLTRAAYRAVKITGAQGQRLQVSLARADNDANSKDTIGLVAEDIGNNQEGFIVTSGTIANINTTGSLQGETWADGDTLYLSGTTSGVITNVKPSAPTHTVILGFVIYAHQNNGKIYVKVDNGYELDELHNVNVAAASSGEYLRYNGTLWTDSSILAADLPTGIDASKIGTGVVSNTEFSYLDGVTSAIQTQLNAKQATISLTTTGSSGSATLVGATLNIPTYTLSGLGGQPQLNGTGFVKASGTTISYDNSTYLPVTLGGTITAGEYIRYNGTAWVDANIQAADLPTAIDAAKIANGTVSNTEFQYLDGVTSAIQTQLNGKQATLTNPVTGTGTTNYIAKFTGTSAVGNSLIQDNGASGVLFGTRLTIRDDAPFISGANITSSGNNFALGTTGGSALQLFTNSAERIRIAADGNVGINATAALVPLTVYNSVANTPVLEIRGGGGSSQTRLQFTYGNASSTNLNGDIFASTTDFCLRAEANRVIWFGTTTSGTSLERMRVQPSGNVSIGNTNDTYKLDISGTIRNTTDAYFATSSGNVGIRTTSPFRQFTIFNAGSSLFGLDSTAYGRTTIGSDNIGKFVVFDDTASLYRFVISSDGNIGIGQTSFGTSATKTLAVSSGTAPTTSPADAFQMYSADITAGNAAAHFRTEGGAIIKLYQQTTGVGSATRVGGGGTTLTDTDTFGGYTLRQIVQALQNAGFLA